MILYWTPWMKRVLVYVCGLVIYMTVSVVMAVNGSTLPWWVMAVAAIATGFLAERVAKPKAKTGGNAAAPPTRCPICGEPTTPSTTGGLFCRKCQRFVG